jgi:hypothetical protein
MSSPFLPGIYEPAIKEEDDIVSTEDAMKSRSADELDDGEIKEHVRQVVIVEWMLDYYLRSNLPSDSLAASCNINPFFSFELLFAVYSAIFSFVPPHAVLLKRRQDLDDSDVLSRRLRRRIALSELKTQALRLPGDPDALATVFKLFSVIVNKNQNVSFGSPYFAIRWELWRQVGSTSR